jgi:hypothetical protein
MSRARIAIERKHSGNGLPHQNLVKFAAHLAAGLDEGFIQARTRGRFDPAEEEFVQALTWAVEQFKSNGYCLRREPNGSMTDVLQTANATNPQPTNEGPEERQSKEGK